MKKVVIVGGGIAGLSAGIYAAQCGFKPLILEQHAIAGGNCTSWRRGEYLFEGGMHWLTGSSKDSSLHPVWRNVGAIDDSTKFICRDTFFEYHHEDGWIKLYRDVKTLEEHLFSVAPQDAKAIKHMCRDIKAFKGMSMMLTDIDGLKADRPAPKESMLPMLRKLPRLIALGRMSCEEFAIQFTHPGLRNALRASMTDDYYAPALIMTLSTMAGGDGGFPEGGSLPFVERMVKRYASLGGEIRYRTRVSRVLVENGRATGVMAEGETISAHAVIVTQDTMVADRLFDTPSCAPWLKRMKGGTLPTMNVFVALGIDTDLSDLPHMFTWKADPVTVGGNTYELLEANNYASMDTFSPKGKTALTMMLAGDTYDFWKSAKDAGRYEDEKQRLAEVMIAALEKEVPRVKGKVEVVDVATPLTYERYCGTWRGSYMTLTPKGAKMQSYPCVIEGLKGCYFAGQRLMPPGGLPVAVTTGRTAVQHLCRDEGAVFVRER